jgi:hypothetical protein
MSQLAIMSMGMIGSITLENIWSLPGPTPLAPDGRNGIYQRQQLRHVVPIRLRDMDRKGNPLSFGNEVVFRPLFTAVRRVRPRFGPPKVARTEELSITARVKSILLLPLSLLNNTLWTASHTPAFCQACKDRQPLTSGFYESFIRIYSNDFTGSDSSRDVKCCCAGTAPNVENLRIRRQVFLEFRDVLLESPIAWGFTTPAISTPPLFVMNFVENDCRPLGP